jgi:predicted DCC family thiol-disulfide oxidoreductase YuxK
VGRDDASAMFQIPRFTVLFDGGCPLCRRTVKALRTIDWLGRLQFVDGTNAAARARIAPGLTEAEILVEMFVIDARGQRHGGYAGYLQLARAVPLLWPFALLGPLPGIRFAGDRLYRFVAANRIRRGRCTDEVCAPAASTPRL